MIKSIVLVVAMALGSVSSNAAVLTGQVTGFQVLNCMVPNTTGKAQVFDQIQYQWTCNYGPMDPFHMNFQAIPCFGPCKVDPGATFFHNFGPFTANCPFVMNAYCRAYTHDAPGN